MTGARVVSSIFFVDSSVPYFSVKGVKSLINQPSLFILLSSVNPMLMLALAFFARGGPRNVVLLNRGLAWCALCDWLLHGYTL
jgi:hypothetical protein